MRIFGTDFARLEDPAKWRAVLEEPVGDDWLTGLEAQWSIRPRITGPETAPQVARVVVTLEDGTEIEASVSGGWYLAWWPGTAYRILSRVELDRIESNPVGRGRCTPGRRFGGQQRGLVPRLTKLPWIPNEDEWLAVLAAFRGESARNRLMLALAYDAALRREELCALRTDDVDPARRMLRVRAETTKNRLERTVPYSAPTGVLLAEYLRHRSRRRQHPSCSICRSWTFTAVTAST